MSFIGKSLAQRARLLSLIVLQIGLDRTLLVSSSWLVEERERIFKPTERIAGAGGRVTDTSREFALDCFAVATNTTLTLIKSSRTETDRIGTVHMHMHFNVSGPLAQGVVNVHMSRKKDEDEFHYHSLALDVPGHERVWLENAEQGRLDKRNQGKMFGVRWW